MPVRSAISVRISPSRWRPGSIAEESDGILVARERDDEDKSRGYSLRLVKGKIQVNLVTRWLDEAIRVETEAPLPLQAWHQITMVYDGSAEARGVRIYVDGAEQKLAVLLDQLNNNFSVNASLRIGSGADPGQRFHGYLRDVKVYEEGLTSSEAAVLATQPAIRRSPAIPEPAKQAAGRQDPRSTSSRRRARPYSGGATRLRAARRRRTTCRKPADGDGHAGAARRRATTFVLTRGAYDKPGEQGRRRRARPPCRCRPRRCPTNRLGLRPLAGRPGESADGARGGEPLLADVSSAPGW